MPNLPPTTNHFVRFLLMFLSCVIFTAAGVLCSPFSLLLTKASTYRWDENLLKLVVILPITLVYWAILWPKISKRDSLRAVIILSIFSQFIIHFFIGFIFGALFDHAYGYYSVSSVLNHGLQQTQYVVSSADIFILTSLANGMVFWYLSRYLPDNPKNHVDDENSHPNPLASNHMESLKSDILKAYHVDAQEIESDPLAKVFSADFFKVKTKRANKHHKTTVDAMTVAVRDGKIFYVDELNTTGDLQVLLNLIQEDYILKSGTDAKLFEEALDILYATDGDDNDIKAIQHENDKWTFIRGKFWEKNQGFVVTTNEKGIITAIRYKDGTEQK